jgi:hypothetical protein
MSYGRSIYCKWVHSWTSTKINILNKKYDFLPLTNLKLLSPLKENERIYIVFKFIISVRCSNCDYLLWDPKHVAMSLFEKEQSAHHGQI